VLLEALNDAYRAGALRLPIEYERSASPLDDRLQALCREVEIPFPEGVVRMALATWSHVHGLVSLELIGQLPGFLGDQAGAFIEGENGIFMSRLGLKA
jgi:hypothetical protein